MPAPGEPMRCSKCGTDNPEGLRFCNECAAPFGRRCSKCGFENAPAAKFCGECAAPLPTGRFDPSQASAQAVRITAEADSQTIVDGERKTVTALFADIKGSTELMEDLDPEEARAIIDPALKLMIDAAHRYDGYVVQSTGDGIFALFGAPVAHEDHPQRALYAALRLQEELERYSARLRAAGNLLIEGRVGVNTGEVVVRSITTRAGQTEYTPIGHTTNLASRMQAVAPTGSIAISEQTRRLVEGYFQLKPLGPTRVKGVSEPVNVYEVTGLGPLRTRLQRAVGRGLTKFVGREREMEALRHAAELARSGRGQIVAAMAEPGVGKSRLFFEFKATSQSGWMVLEAFSVSYGKASAYLPVIDLLRNYFRIAIEDDERTRREKVTGRVVALDRSLEDTLPYLFTLLGIVEGDDPLAQMDGQVKKRRTLEAIKRIVLRESLNQPLMVIFEDLHWIDEQTQAFLNLLAESISTAKILLLVNYRPEYSHQWNSKTYYMQLRLDPLAQDSAEEMLAVLLGTSPAPATQSPGAHRERSSGDLQVAGRVRASDSLEGLERLIIDRTEGNPFFMEETVQALLDEGALVRDGTAVKLTKSLNALQIPSTVQGILAARIDRLPVEEKELLQTLAVIGREFALSLVRRVFDGRESDELERMLADLQLVEFIYEQPATGDVEYIFKHALTQEVAYNSLLIERRKQLHERAGAALETLFIGQLEDHLDELAHHYSRSANPEKAVEYLTRAGQRAQNRSAFAEAQAQLQQGLEWIKMLADSPERDARELVLASTLAQVLMVTRGYAAPEAREASARARDLAEKSGDLALFVRHIFGIWTFALVSGDLSTAGQLADRILDLAQREGSPTSLSLAHDAKVQTCFFRADLVGAEEHFARWSAFREAASEVHPGQRLFVIGVAAIAMWTSGYFERAREPGAQAIASARNSSNPYDLAVARFFESWLYSFLREPHSAEVAAAQTLAICEDQGFLYLSNLTLAAMGWARAQLGGASEGVSILHQGLVGLAKIGARVIIVDHLTRLAEAQALDGKIDAVFITIDDALRQNPEQLVYRPEAFRVRGELRFKVSQTELAEADFREAIALAQKMQAKAWELRATMSLARLLARQGRRDEARAMLVKIYGWFTEGFDTADLKDAKALLDELT